MIFLLYFLSQELLLVGCCAPPPPPPCRNCLLPLELRNLLKPKCQVLYLSKNVPSLLEKHTNQRRKTSGWGWLEISAAVGQFPFHCSLFPPKQALTPDGRKSWFHTRQAGFHSQLCHLPLSDPGQATSISRSVSPHQ